MSAEGFLGAGDVLLEVYEPGVGWAGLKGPYAAEKFEIKADSEMKRLVARGRSNYGATLAAVPVPKPFELNVTFTKPDKLGMSLALMGTAAAVSQTSGSLADEAVVMKKDVWVPLSKANIAATGYTLKDTTGVTTYVEGTDYLLNRQLGLVLLLGSGSAIADGASCKFSGPYLAISGSLVRGATQTSVRCRLTLDGINFADGSPVIVRTKEVVISSKAALDFLASDFGKIPLSGELTQPAGATEPFTVELRDAA